MDVLDYHRSFFMTELDLAAFPPTTVSDQRQNNHNRARIRIDCRCQVTEPSGATMDYYLGESCKTERVGATRELGIFTQPNSDFRPVVSEVDGIIIKSYDRNGRAVSLDPPTLGLQPERQPFVMSEVYMSHRFKLVHTAGDLLLTPESVVEATSAGRPIVARTEFESSGYKVLLEYPVFTINVSERHVFYQTDTGPVIYPDFSSPFETRPEAFWLAYCAFNTPDWAEFILQKPTPVGEGIAVNHYSESVWVDCANTLIATE